MSTPGLDVPGAGDFEESIPGELEAEDGGIKESPWGHRPSSETYGEVEGEDEGDESIDADEDGYFDYEEELKRQEKAMMEKFGFQFGFGDYGGIPLTSDMIGRGLSSIGRPADSTQLAYMTFEASSKDLGDVEALRSYTNLTTVILTDNKLRSLLPLERMQYLKVLNVEGNSIETLEDVPLESFRWLQALHLGSNKLETLEGIRPNMLLYLHLARNSLDSVQYFTSEYFPNLLSLELRGNRLTTIEGLDLPKLRQLFIAENELSDLSGIAGCRSLETLHARQNQITRLTISSTMEKLDYVNLRDNQIRNFTETLNFEKCPNLKTLVMTGNLIWQKERYKEEMLASCISLKRLDRVMISELESVEGRQLRAERRNGTVPTLDDDTDDPVVVNNVSEVAGEGEGDAENEEEGQEENEEEEEGSTELPETDPVLTQN